MPDEQTPPSVADSLNAAFDTVEQASTAPDTAQAPVAPVEKSAPAVAAETPAADKGSAPQRGPDGKFLRRGDAAPAPATDAAPAPSAPAAQPAADAAKVAAAAPAAGAPDAAPSSWTPTAKEKWNALDPAVKAEVVRREREIETGLQRASDVRKFGDSVMQEFAPYAQILAKEGATPQGAIRSLLETVHTLRYGSPEHKHALFMSLAQQYGIDVTKEIDPEKARLQWELDSRNARDARAQTDAQVELQRDVQSELEAFIATPGHEHYPTVRQAMAGLMQSGVAQNLQDAYDRACWADPTVRAALQAAESLKKAADQAKNRNALAAVNGAPGAVSTGGPAVDPTNLRALIESQFAVGSGRV